MIPIGLSRIHVKAFGKLLGTTLQMKASEKCLIWNLYIDVQYCVTNSWLNHRRRDKGRERLPNTGWRQFPAFPSAPEVELRVHINGQHTNFQFGKLRIINEKQMIIVVNFFLV
jgi:hypothetical protein